MSSSHSKRPHVSSIGENIDTDIEMTSDDDATEPSEPLNEDAQMTSEPSRASKQVVRKYKHRSRCWKHFREIKENGRRVAGECKHCGKIYKAASDKNGTKNMNKHIPKCPNNPKNKSKEVQTQLVLERDSNNEGEAELKSWILDPHEARLAIVKHIVIDELPFRHVEKDGFKLMLSVLAPGLKVPSRTTIARDVYQLYVNERVLLKQHLVNACQRVCVTTDTWTSLQRLNYMCVTAHFVDNDWKLQKRIISFCTISSHKGDAIALALTMCLDDWGLLDKMYTVTVDNAGSNSTACTALIEDFKRTQHHLFSKGNFLHVRCVAHILNLVVWDGLKVVGKSVSRIRAAVKFIRQSPSRETRFYECALAEKIECKASLCLDTPTRWNSTYKMLNIAQKYENAFLKYAKIDPYFVIDFSKDKVDKVDRPPNAKDWAQARHLIIFLEAFYDATLHLSGTSYVTSNLLFFDIVAIYKMLQNLEDIDEVIEVQDLEIAADGEEDEAMVSNFKEMANRMKLKFEKYYGKPEKLNTLVYISPIFDPRYKLEGLEICVCDLFGETNGDNIMKKVKESVDALFDEYWELYKPSQAQSGQSGAILSELENATSMSSQTYAQQLQKRLKGTHRARGTELQKYLNEGLEEDSEVGDDLLGWWRVHGPRYPVLACMARDILAVPVSTVASESAFSTGGRHLDAFRTSLTPKMVQALICSQDWLKTSKKIDMEETLDELKSVEKDMVNLSVHDCVVDTADVLRL